MSTFIETFSGERFQPLAPALDTIWIEDIAHHLSQLCRFTGATREFYSVAEHSVRVSRLVKEWGHDEDHQFWGLMHDASEFSLSDVSTPLKHDVEFGAAYRKAEKRQMKTICERFAMSETEPLCVKEADAVLLATEVRDLMPNKKEHWGQLMVRPLPMKLVPWPPKVAEARFLELFHELDGQR